MIRGANGVALGGESVKSIFTTTEHAVRIIVDDRDNPSMVAHFEGGNEAEYAIWHITWNFYQKVIILKIRFSSLEAYIHKRVLIACF